MAPASLSTTSSSAGPCALADVGGTSSSLRFAGAAAATRPASAAASASRFFSFPICSL
jgi:hypothetical protein